MEVMAKKMTSNLFASPHPRAQISMLIENVDGFRGLVFCDTCCESHIR